MIGGEQILSTSEITDLRKLAGKWLQREREACGLSQTELARLVGVDYYSFISQIENGRGKIPANRYRVWADAFNMDHRIFVIKILEYYDPYVYDILFRDAA